MVRQLSGPTSIRMATSTFDVFCPEAAPKPRGKSAQQQRARPWGSPLWEIANNVGQISSQRSQTNRRDLIAAGAAVVTISGSALAQTSHDHHTAPSSLFDAPNSCVKAGLSAAIIVCRHLQRFSMQSPVAQRSTQLIAAGGGMCRYGRPSRRNRGQHGPRKIEITFADQVFSPHPPVMNGFSGLQTT